MQSRVMVVALMMQAMVEARAQAMVELYCTAPHHGVTQVASTATSVSNGAAAHSSRTSLHTALRACMCVYVCVCVCVCVCVLRVCVCV